jgi:hypothetical protein
VIRRARARSATRVATLALCAALAISACGEEAPSSRASGSDNGGDGAGDPGSGANEGGAASREPLYVLTSNVWGTDGAMGYLYTVPSLASGSATLDHAIEFGGGAWIAGRDGDRFVYVSSGDGGPTITRWEVTDDGRLEEGPTISFQQLGLASGMRFGTAPILSDTKAYLVDSAQHRIATWNPREIEAAHYVVDGKTYVGNPSADWSATTIVELDPEGALRVGLTVEGTPGRVVRAR